MPAVSGLQHQGNPLDRVTRHGFVLVVAARSSGNTLACMFDRLAKLGIDRGGKGVQQRQDRPDIEAPGAGEPVQSRDSL